jgi:hypothetical protein
MKICSGKWSMLSTSIILNVCTLHVVCRKFSNGTPGFGSRFRPQKEWDEGETFNTLRGHYESEGRGFGSQWGHWTFQFT